MMTIIEALRNYVMDFPELKDGCLYVDFLGNTPVEYAVEKVPCDPVFKKYTDGSCVKQFYFYSQAVNFTAKMSTDVSKTTSFTSISRHG